MKKRQTRSYAGVTANTRDSTPTPLRGGRTKRAAAEVGNTAQATNTPMANRAKLTLPANNVRSTSTSNQTGKPPDRADGTLSGGQTTGNTLAVQSTNSRQVGQVESTPPVNQTIRPVPDQQPDNTVLVVQAVSTQPANRNEGSQFLDETRGTPLGDHTGDITPAIKPRSATFAHQIINSLPINQTSGASLANQTGEIPTVNRTLAEATANSTENRTTPAATQTSGAMAYQEGPVNNDNFLTDPSRRNLLEQVNFVSAGSRGPIFSNMTPPPFQLNGQVGRGPISVNPVNNVVGNVASANIAYGYSASNLNSMARLTNRSSGSSTLNDSASTSVGHAATNLNTFISAPAQSTTGQGFYSPQMGQWVPFIGAQSLSMIQPPGLSWVDFSQAQTTGTNSGQIVNSAIHAQTATGNARQQEVLAPRFDVNPAVTTYDQASNVRTAGSNKAQAQSSSRPKKKAKNFHKKMEEKIEKTVRQTLQEQNSQWVNNSWYYQANSGPPPPPPARYYHPRGAAGRGAPRPPHPRPSAPYDPYAYGYNYPYGHHDNYEGYY